MARIDEALANTENPEVLTAILIETGAYHKKIPGFNPQMFWVRISFLTPPIITDYWANLPKLYLRQPFVL